MKTILYLAFLSMLAVGCKHNDAQNGKSLKQEIVKLTKAVSENDLDKIVKLLPSQKILKNVSDVNENDKSLIQKIDFFKYRKKFGDKKILDQLTGEVKEWSKQKPILLVISPTTGDNIKLAEFIFSMNGVCYDMQVYVIKHQNKNYFAFKDQIQKIRKKCDDVTKRVKKNITDDTKNNYISY